MAMSEQEKNQLLAELAGLEVRLQNTPTGEPEMWAQFLTGYINLGWIDFLHSLDSCFKYLCRR